MRTQLKEIAFADLVSILERASQLSVVTQSEKSMSYDFDRCKPYLADSGLQEHIIFVRRSLKKLPLNSERHLYETSNIVIRDLHINLALKDQSAWTAHDDWWPLSSVKWHFKNCCFEASTDTSIPFPWTGSFRFYKNRFNVHSGLFGGTVLFEFQTGSRIQFERNNCGNHQIQTRCVPPPPDSKDADTGITEIGDSGSISLIGNRAIASLHILEGYSSVSLTGMNQIDSLLFMRLSDVNSHGAATHNQEFKVYFGPREKIDRNFHHCSQHREMFLSLRRLATVTYDMRQLVVLDKQIDRIEYFLNKGQDTPSPLDFRIWIEYWQDRILYAWRRWSSDFYKSWLRPLIMILSGYVVMNWAPIFFVDTFSWSHWIDFSLRPVGEIPQYEKSLIRIIGAEYGELSSSAKTSLRLLGLVQVVWIAMWSFAFVRSIRR